MTESETAVTGLLSEAETARRLGVSLLTLKRARYAGRISFYRVGTRVLYDPRHLTEFLNRAESKATAA